MNKYTIELTKEQLKQLGIEIEPKFIYPLFKQFKSTGEIVKFTSISKGVTVWKGSKYGKVGYTSDTFVKHTNNGWENVSYNKERDLWDKQPVECWENIDTHKRESTFYDAKNRCSFTYAGERGGLTYNNYKAIPADKYDDWILEAYQTLKN